MALGVRRWRPRQARPWYLFAAGQVSFVIGDSIRAYYEHILQVEAPLYGAADAFHLLAYPLLAAGLLALIRSRDPSRDRSSLIDAMIIAVSVGVIAWFFLMRPYANDPDLGLVERVISISYPIADLVLVSFAARLAIGPGVRTKAYYLLGGSILTLLVADSWYAVMLLDETYRIGSPPDAGFLHLDRGRLTEQSLSRTKRADAAAEGALASKDRASDCGQQDRAAHEGRHRGATVFETELAACREADEEQSRDDVAVTLEPAGKREAAGQAGDPRHLVGGGHRAQVAPRAGGEQEEEGEDRDEQRPEDEQAGARAQDERDAERSGSCHAREPQNRPDARRARHAQLEVPRRITRGARRRSLAALDLSLGRSHRLRWLVRDGSGLARRGGAGVAARGRRRRAVAIAVAVAVDRAVECGGGRLLESDHRSLGVRHAGPVAVR